LGARAIAAVLGVAAIGLRFRRAQPEVVVDVVVEEAEAA